MEMETNPLNEPETEHVGLFSDEVMSDDLDLDEGLENLPVQGLTFELGRVIYGHKPEGAFLKSLMFKKLVNYVKGTRAEMKHVKWPNRKQVINSTMLVIAAALAVALFLGVFDMIFTFLIEKFIL